MSLILRHRIEGAAILMGAAGLIYMLRKLRSSSTLHRRKKDPNALPVLTEDRGLVYTNNISSLTTVGEEHRFLPKELYSQVRGVLL